MDAADARKARLDVHHASEQRRRRRIACDTIGRIADGWRDLRGLYPPTERRGGGVIRLPHDSDPSGPHQAVAA